jgi:HECT-domain (ubiquitin-transferase)
VLRMACKAQHVTTAAVSTVYSKLFTTAATRAHTYTHLTTHNVHNRNLVFLKRYNGDSIEDLCLTFTVTDECFGSTTETELVPGGASRSVTARNRLEYVNRVAKYYLVDRVSAVALTITVI